MQGTCDAGKVEIGAFRTYPEGYTPPDSKESEYQPIPLSKIEDFGVHADMYYTLDLSIFKTSLDSQIIKLLWNKYWANTLSASPLLANDGFIGGQLEDLGVLLLCFLHCLVYFLMTRFNKFCTVIDRRAMLILSVCDEMRVQSPGFVPVQNHSLTCMLLCSAEAGQGVVLAGWPEVQRRERKEQRAAKGRQGLRKASRRAAQRADKPDCQERTFQ